MQNKYKKGDWVRAAHEAVTKHWNECWSRESGFVAKPDSVFQIGEVNHAGNRIGAGSVKLGPHWYDEDLEPWQPKVGERVRYVANYNDDMGGKEVTVVEIVEPTRIMVDTRSHWGRCTEHIKDLEPIADSLPVAEQPAALKIQAGRYYKTRDGRKVGPMAARSWGGFFDDSRSVTSQHWSASGTFIEGCISNLDLIAEWVDAPVRDITAATVDAVNDEYGPVVREVPVAQQPARFKVGDWVTKEEWASPDGWEVAKITDKRIWLRVVGYTDAVGYDLPDEDFILVKSAVSAIVCKIDNGQPLPATRPAVHATVESADAEARRLANLHHGQEFGVYALTGTPHRVARVYEHEWQRLAAEGEKAKAMLELRKLAGLTIRGAREAVDAYVDYQRTA